MNETEHFDDRTALLLSELRQIKVIEKREEIPAFTNIFSRRLNRLIPALRGVGVEVQLRHEEDGSFCELRRLATFQRESAALPKEADDSRGGPSAVSSVVTTKAGTDLQLPDGSDGNVRIDTAKSAKAVADEAAIATKTNDAKSNPNANLSDADNSDGGAS